MKTNFSRVFAASTGLLLSGAAAYAQGSGFYFKADLGGNVSEDVEIKEFLGLNIPGAKLELDPGVRAGVGGGYNFTDWLAAEAEIGFVENEIHGVKGASYSIHDATLANVPFLLNARLQYPMGRCPVTPYIGAGAGFSESIFDVDHLAIADGSGNSVSIHGSDADAVFAWQAFAGVRYALNERMGLGIEYRYFEADSPSWHAEFTQGTASDLLKLGKSHTHSLSVSFAYSF